ncbi:MULTISPECIES: hypothetical protein [unclassified Prevotella]|uniref:hypothetical protein n=1 Tax=unclassified Prevotella TaxID=2638335 RepID=UPI00048EC61D|nr:MULTISPECIES: hypothetical protein [unclassified Prevotella]
MPTCTDTTYWRIVDLQDVVGVKYDKLFLIGSDFEEDIARETGKSFFQPWGWLRNHKSKPWGHGVSLKKGKESEWTN